MHVIKPLQQVPRLMVQTLEGNIWNLFEQKPAQFLLMVFYRGYHCLRCKDYIHQLDIQVDEFAALGIETIAISCDTEERAQMAKNEWYLQKLKIGYELSIEDARKWGLFISKKIFNLEPEQFSEPGIFIINPDHTLYGSIVQSMPFSRPLFTNLLADMGYIIEHEYPARGSY